jgi:hypothetical protein
MTKFIKKNLWHYIVLDTVVLDVYKFFYRQAPIGFLLAMRRLGQRLGACQVEEEFDGFRVLRSGRGPLDTGHLMSFSDLYSIYMNSNILLVY